MFLELSVGNVRHFRGNLFQNVRYKRLHDMLARDDLIPMSCRAQ